MTSPSFFQTRMGMKFYEGTMPKVADQLERLNANIEALVVELKLQREDRRDGDDGKKADGQQ